MLSGIIRLVVPCLHGQTKDYNGRASPVPRSQSNFIWILNHTACMSGIIITWFYNACTAGYHPCNNSASSDNGAPRHELLPNGPKITAKNKYMHKCAMHKGRLIVN